MLVGLLGKNAIMIVEFAIKCCKEEASILKTVVQGSLSRLRPILMTSLAFIAGLIPLVIASGAGAMNNRSFGTAAAGWMLTGTVFGPSVIPSRFVLIGSIGKGRRNLKEKIVSGKKLFFPMKPYNRFAQAKIGAAILLFIVVLASSSGCAPMKEL